MKLGKKIKQPLEMEARYDDDSGKCGKFSYNENSKEWEYEPRFSELDEEECFGAYTILKQLNNRVAKTNTSSHKQENQNEQRNK